MQPTSTPAARLRAREVQLEKDFPKKKQMKLGTGLSPEECKQMKEYIKSFAPIWNERGVTIMCNGWQGSTNMHIINLYTLLVVQSVDATDVYKKDANYYFCLMEKVVEEVGEERLARSLWAINYIKEFTGSRELARHGITRFATQIVMLETWTNDRSFWPLKFVSYYTKILRVPWPLEITSQQWVLSTWQWKDVNWPSKEIVHTIRLIGK
ncbi:Uridylate kinase [Bienertia sinuspersici]